LRFLARDGGKRDDIFRGRGRRHGKPFFRLGFPLEHEDLTGIGCKLNALGDGMAEDELDQFFRSEGLW